MKKKVPEFFFAVLTFLTACQNANSQSFAQDIQSGTEGLPKGHFQSEVAGRPKIHSAAVVEFFTSAGCSSCAEVDKELSRIKKDAERKKLPVYILSCHVDYDKEAGVHDKFANAACTEQQSRYSSYLKRGRLGVPHLIVNGAVSAPSFIPLVLDSLVARGTKKPFTRSVEISAVADSGLKKDGPAGALIRVHYRVGGYKSRRNGRFDLLRLILIRAERSKVVGESDREDVNPVEAIETLRVEENIEGTLDFPLADPSSAKTLKVLAAVHDGRTYEVIAASMVNVSDRE